MAARNGGSVGNVIEKILYLFLLSLPDLPAEALLGLVNRVITNLSCNSCCS